MALWLCGDGTQGFRSSKQALHRRNHIPSSVVPVQLKMTTICMELCWLCYISERETTFGLVRLPAGLMKHSCCHPPRQKADKHQPAVCSTSHHRLLPPPSLSTVRVSVHTHRTCAYPWNVRVPLERARTPGTCAHPWDVPSVLSHFSFFCLFHLNPRTPPLCPSWNLPTGSVCGS